MNYIKIIDVLKLIFTGSWCFINTTKDVFNQKNPVSYFLCWNEWYLCEPKWLSPKINQFSHWSVNTWSTDLMPCFNLRDSFFCRQEKKNKLPFPISVFPLSSEQTISSCMILSCVYPPQSRIFPLSHTCTLVETEGKISGEGFS